MSARNFWELSSKKTCFLEVALALRQLNLIQKRDHSVVSFKLYIYIYTKLLTNYQDKLLSYIYIYILYIYIYIYIYTRIYKLYI